MTPVTRKGYSFGQHIRHLWPTHQLKKSSLLFSAWTQDPPKWQYFTRKEITAAVAGDFWFKIIFAGDPREYKPRSIKHDLDILSIHFSHKGLRIESLCAHDNIPSRTGANASRESIFNARTGKLWTHRRNCIQLFPALFTCNQVQGDLRFVMICAWLPGNILAYPLLQRACLPAMKHINKPRLL